VVSSAAVSAHPLDARAVWAHSALSRRVLCDVAARLGRRGVDVMAVKGIVTSSWLYGDTSERPLSDVDVRIRPAEFARVVEVATREGWGIDRCVWTYKNLVLCIDGVSVDVEAQVGPPFVCGLTTDQMFARAARCDGGYWVPEAHDHAVLLAVNLFKDKIRCAFPWAVEDVTRLVATPGFDPATFVLRVREAGIRGPAWVVAVARHLFSSHDPLSLPVRLVARAGADDPLLWPLALAASAAWSVEQRLDRRGRACASDADVSTSQAPVVDIPSEDRGVDRALHVHQDPAVSQEGR
jgi:hypothetical protein